MPFIQFTKKHVKYSTEKGRITKPRNLLYCSHVDAYIYQLYTQKLTPFYNNLVKSLGINRSVIAYRNIFKGKCNIHFAYDVFNQIRITDDCYIIVGDFTKFFDTLDHKYLKEQCCRVLGESILPEDFYQVYKSLTKFSYFEIDDLIKLTGCKDFEELNKRDLIFQIEQYRELKYKYLKRNRNNYGIPQGGLCTMVHKPPNEQCLLMLSE